MTLKLRTFTYLLALAFAFGAIPASAYTKWAVTASLNSNSIFLIKYDNGTATKYLLDQLNGSSFTGVEYGNGYVFVADNTATGAVLRVGKLVNPLSGIPSISWLEPISLGSTLKQPGAIAMDAYGGIYVVGSRWNDAFNVKHSNYAYVKSSSGNWNSATVTITDRNTTSFADVASAGNIAIFADRDISTHTDQTCALRSTDASSMATGDGGYFPQAITAGKDGISYIANSSTSISGSVANTGSISIVNSSLGKLLTNAAQLGTFQPTDIAFFSIDGIDYLGLVGTEASGISEALRITLDEDGLPTLDDNGQISASNIRTQTLDSSITHFCTASEDNTLFWVTNPQAKTVTCFDTSTWSMININMDASIGYIVGFVPEPSSVMALLVGCISLFGLSKRRKA